jgi:phosphoribosylaminoimidazole (AIR) synthetase
LRELSILHQHVPVKGLAHITGGGFPGNISRILPAGTRAVIETTTWPVPPLFQLLARLGNIPRTELYSIFNMGIGMVLVISPAAIEKAQSTLPELLTIGAITTGSGVRIK